MHEYGKLTRADLSRIACLTETAVSALTTDLVNLGVLQQRRKNSEDDCSSAIELSLNPSASLAVGISIEDPNRMVLNITNLVGDVVAFAVGEDFDNLDVGYVISQVRNLFVHNDLDYTRLAAVGMATPNQLVQCERVSQLCAQLEQRLCKKVWVQDSLSLAALAERANHRIGDQVSIFVRASDDLRVVLMLPDRRPSVHQKVGGNSGHLIVPWISERCTCGNTGCINGHVGNGNLIQRTQSAGLKTSTVQELIALCRAGEPTAERLVADAGRAVGYALAMLINPFAPCTIIVSGALNDAGDHYFTPLREMARHYCVGENFSSSTIKASPLCADSPAIGAAIYALSKTDDIYAGAGEIIKS